MIGIYKIQNLLNGKVYIGQSNDIQRRFQEHQRKGSTSRIPLDVAIQKYGAENFSYEIVEECQIDELNEKETEWILYWNSHEEGYNCNTGGDQASIGSQNSNAKLTEEEVMNIRIAYANRESQKETYQQYKDKITWFSFQNLWQGRSWPHIMPEVFTKENKDYYSYEASRGEKSSSAIFTDEEVLLLRQRYVSQSAPLIFEDYKDRLSYQALQQILWGRHYGHLPIYSKKKKVWFNK